MQLFLALSKPAIISLSFAESPLREEYFEHDAITSFKQRSVKQKQLYFTYRYNFWLTFDWYFISQLDLFLIYKSDHSFPQSPRI